jgi:hypothetical protein
VDVQSYSKVDGQPFKSQEILDHLTRCLAERAAAGGPSQMGANR